MHHIQQDLHAHSVDHTVQRSNHNGKNNNNNNNNNNKEYNVDNNNNDNNNNNNDNVYASRLMMSQVCAGQVLSLQAKEPLQP